MLLPSVGGVEMRELLDWVQDQTGIGRQGPRKFYFLIAGAILLIVRALLSDLAVLRPLADFAEAALYSLASINTVSLIGAFIENVRCGTTDRLGEVLAACDAARLVNPINYIVGLPLAVIDVLRQGLSDAALIVYLLAGVTGYALTLTFWRRYLKPSEMHLGHLVVIVLGTVIATTAVALALQISGIVLFWVFGRVIGLLILLAGDLKIVVDLSKAARRLEKLRKGEYSLSEAAGDAAGAAGLNGPLEVASKLAENSEMAEKSFNWFRRRFPPN